MESSPSEVLRELFRIGLSRGSSDIHVEPQKDYLVIRMRTDGLLLEEERMEKSLHLPLISCAKIMADLDIAEKRLPQDGHIRAGIDGKDLDIRLSLVPTIYGEKAVFRFLNTDAVVENPDTFGMSDENYKKVMRILEMSGGVFYITGPTGSGKTTTLYMILEKLRARPVNIMTVEDPAEKFIDGISQIQVNQQAGLTFEKGLRAILRQDPDIIMVGETRDSQTAKISVRAAITGHLVLSTLHTKDALGVVTRLLDLGVEPYFAADSLCGAAAQRLVQKICPNCKKERAATKEECRILGKESLSVYEGTGCALCGGRGDKGRMAVHEIVVIDRNLRRMIGENRPMEEMYRYAVEEQKMETMESALRKLVIQGEISIREFLRLTAGK